MRVKLTRRRMHFDASRSLAELGLQPRPVAQSIAEMVEWFKHLDPSLTLPARSTISS